MAMQFLLEGRLENKETVDLLSCNNIVAYNQKTIIRSLSAEQALWNCDTFMQLC